MAEVADDVSQAIIGAAIAGIMSRHTSAVRSGIFERYVCGSVDVRQNEVVADDGRYRSAPSQRVARIGTFFHEESQSGGGESFRR